mgnify:CR=1 FL=1
MYCKYCGHEIPDLAVICVHCGNKVTKENAVYDSPNFSSKDLTNSYMNGMGKKEYSSYLGTPNNTYLKYNPKAKGNGVTIIRQGSN